MRKRAKETLRRARRVTTKRTPNRRALKRAAKRPAAPEAFASVLAGLRDIARPYASLPGMKLAKDAPDGCLVLAPPNPRFKQSPEGLWFACARVGKAYVSYHLMPIYVSPGLLDLIPADLKKRMQGKACFNFKEPDPTLFAKLRTLTRAAYKTWKREGLV